MAGSRKDEVQAALDDLRALHVRVQMLPKDHVPPDVRDSVLGMMDDLEEALERLKTEKTDVSGS